MTICAAPAVEQARLDDLRRDSPSSFGAMFLRRAARTPDEVAYRRPGSEGGWIAQTWAETASAVREIAAGLITLGLRPEDRVAIASGTSVEWIEVDFGVMCAGGATTTVYPSSSAEEVAHILTDSGSRFAFVADAAQEAKVGPHVERVFRMDGLGELRAAGREALAADPELVRRTTDAVGPDDLATLIYTSGTTGLPKGVRITHGAWVYQGLAIQAMGFLRTDDVGYLWLPLSHAFGKALLSCQLSVGFEFAVDGDVSRIVQRLAEVRPTIMPAVPRIFEKVYAGVGASVGGGLKGRLFAWAVKAGHRNVLADRLVLSKVRARFGGRMRFFISGAAALSPDIAAWFGAVGLPIAEGYGMTETCATTVFNRPDAPDYGTVGRPLPGTDVRIAEDGEVLLRGPGIMSGYHGLDSGETLVDGWLHTGDIGEITESGSLRITDRKKDLIKTSNGKYVAPQAIEARFKAICPVASQILIHGDGRKYITALIDLDPEITRTPEVEAEVAACVERLNAGLNPWETVKRFLILDEHLDVESGLLTPSMKLRRRKAEERYRSRLDGLYT
ncbi:long-chain acyl-CoA synthetase [Actinoplanes campanulatus]|uniref:Long-chain acyl-CoA synthetase n=1 Tax=Actinoplanes campanulatus TaxID=113559 RepID=A0A7W5FE34_9ACTN|nr:long-chain fatty acid--CoA ligase [Actinoplanes campanulatus]MBB3094917.1 long-chain acyl-CoA synthetase [Actinoplanes campanulatus]GGN08344.1 AMP-dependent synthetase [Actinoplanes campanulatus]GID36212.1 AMP-dependent synthetase [Actinoplanes campanulatus]